MGFGPRHAATPVDGGQVEELAEGAGLGDVDIVAGKEPQGAAAEKQIPEVLVDEVEAAGHGEGDGDVDLVSQVDVAAQVGPGTSHTPTPQPLDHSARRALRCSGPRTALPAMGPPTGVS